MALRFIKKEYREDVHKWLIEATCESTDAKPGAGYMTGSILTEVDTGTVYFYDEDADEGEEWVEQFSFQGE